jgi:hypothetical protein
MSKAPVIYYAVTLERGDNWDPSRSMREQEKWDEHIMRTKTGLINRAPPIKIYFHWRSAIYKP